MLNPLQTLHWPSLFVDSAWKLDALVNIIPSNRTSKLNEIGSVVASGVLFDKLDVFKYYFIEDFF